MQDAVANDRINLTAIFSDWLRAAIRIFPRKLFEKRFARQLPQHFFGIRQDKMVFMSAAPIDQHEGRTAASRAYVEDCLSLAAEIRQFARYVLEDRLFFPFS